MRNIRPQFFCASLFVLLASPFLAGCLTVEAAPLVAAGESSPKILAANPRLELIELGTYATGIFDDSAAEIVDYDAASRRLFVTNSAQATVDILDLTVQWRPTLLRQIDLSPWGSPNSVATRDGLVAVAVAAEPQTDPGRVVFFDVDGALLGEVVVGALPDMVTFTPDGQRVVTANEGEPADGIDPPGSVSIVDLSAGVASATVTTAGFAAFDGREAELRARGIRLFPGTAASLDLEPEFVAISPDGSQARVSLQEANALAVVDLPAAQVLDILPLGAKDHSRGPATVTSYSFPPLPVLGTTATADPADPETTVAGQDILLGGLSGLWFEGIDVFTGRYRFATVPDRGPNGEPTDVDGDQAAERPFALPDYQARVVRFTLDPVTGSIEIGDSTLLWRADGTTPISGRPNIPGVDEEPVDLFGNLLAYDEYGADMEGVAIAPDGSIWTVDEYRPAIYHFSADGHLIARYVAAGTGALGGMPAGTYGTETLPAEYSSRRRNRGFEALALDATGGVLYAFLQTPLANPDRAASDGSDVIRVLAIDTADGTPVAEYVYLLEGLDARAAKVDKIGDAVWLGGGKLCVLERDSAVDRVAKKLLFEVDLKGATNLLDGAPALLPGLTLEQHTADQLVALGIRPLHKSKVANLPSLGYLAGDKPEGLALLPGGRLAVLNDNDFGLLDQEIAVDGTVPINPEPTPVVLGLIDFPAGNRIDPSDRDAGIRLANWPVSGLYMPDSIKAYEWQGETYYVTANEGDARSEDSRIKDLVLDPTAFPDPAIQDDAQLGRLEVSTLDGDLDQDGDFDRLYAYGGRSFSIWDRFGNLVFDSGDQLAQLIAAVSPNDFNANNDENGSFESRSDNKGSEPEALEIGAFRGRRYAFVGLERVGGVAVWDITEPHASTFAYYLNSRDFDGDAAAGTAGDLGPESIVYIPRDRDRGILPTLVVANEVSGTVTVYRVRYVAND